MARGVTKADQYREYWAYLRHVETLRFQMAGIVAILVSAVLGFVITSDIGPRERFGAGWTLALFLGLELFVAAAGAYMVEHKNNYTWYLKQIRRIAPGPVWQKPHFEVFGWLMLMLALVQTGIACVGIAELSERRLWNALVLGLVYVVTLGYWLARYRAGVNATHPSR